MLGKKRRPRSSSPHTRGSSRRQLVGHARHAVVPAHAGVIPGRRPKAWTRPGRPRTRGGHPREAAVYQPEDGSSPHTRGSSRRRGAGAEACRVVPAHAGVIPTRAPATRLSSRRPRTRGGHPALTIGVDWMERSSPHTRGSSRVGLDAGRCLDVVPAHAGVIRRASTSSGRASSRPRTRGGHPHTRALPKRQGWSSPHTRGSSHGYSGHPAAQVVVPAHAGVILMTVRRGTLCRRRPRTRGGHPAQGVIDAVVTKSSPHTRGSSCTVKHTTWRERVVPAHAGVIPREKQRLAAWLSRPRTRGGHPYKGTGYSSQVSSSPHTRGSSRLRRRSSPRRTVVPAHAGVILRRPGPWDCRPGRPRTRGGHPDGEVVVGAGGTSSPHTRGSSHSADGRVVFGRVVPAHAGVILLGLRAGTWPSVSSSPHTRGSSRRCDGRLHAHLVVPAHAGVIPPTTPMQWTSRCRPRTRGGHPHLEFKMRPGEGSSPHTRGSSSLSRSHGLMTRVVPAHAGVIR